MASGKFYSYVWQEIALGVTQIFPLFKFTHRTLFWRSLFNHVSSCITRFVYVKTMTTPLTSQYFSMSVSTLRKSTMNTTLSQPVYLSSYLKGEKNSWLVTALSMYVTGMRAPQKTSRNRTSLQNWTTYCEGGCSFVCFLKINMRFFVLFHEIL